MHGVVSLFDKKSDRIVRSLWKELETAFDIRGVYRTPYPHFSYQIASDYNFSKLERKLEQFSNESKRFTVHASGLGVFTGVNPVLYMPIARTLELSRLHGSLWKKISPVSSGISPHYTPEFWMPHITLAQCDINQRNLPTITSKLGTRDLSFEIKIDNLAIIFDDGTTQNVRSKFPFPNNPNSD